ncbi:MAG: class I SAM-dependent methyltransferase [Armatimonadota bacterium]|nr:class I SAM-dependent methyltransferase [Armatimonadota bacterium]
MAETGSAGNTLESAADQDSSALHGTPAPPTQGTPRRVPPSLYDERYYLTNMEGYDLFLESHGRRVTPRHAKVLQIARIQPGERVLDVGCGRGELACQAALAGAWARGIDYSAAAIALCREAWRTYPQEVRRRLVFEQVDANTALGTPNSYDVVFLIDVVEHLYPEELQRVLVAIYQVLRPGGRLILHTAPNVWFYRYAYPVARLLFPLIRRVSPSLVALARTKPNWQGDTLPRHPEEGQEYNVRVHVNEQSPRTLRQALRRAGFSPRLKMIPFTRQASGPALSLLYTLLALPPFRAILCAEIVAVARKPCR